MEHTEPVWVPWQVPGAYSSVGPVKTSAVIAQMLWHSININMFVKRWELCNYVHRNDGANVCDKFQTFCGIPKRTILLDDIEDIMDEEDLQDHLEIHFQKPSNHGGEIEHIKYTPKGKALQTIFLCEDMAAVNNWPAGANLLQDKRKIKIGNMPVSYEC